MLLFWVIFPQHLKARMFSYYMWENWSVWKNLFKKEYIGSLNKVVIGQKLKKSLQSPWRKSTSRNFINNWRLSICTWATGALQLLPFKSQYKPQSSKQCGTGIKTDIQTNGTEWRTPEINPDTYGLLIC